MKGTFQLTKNATLKIIVGQKGTQESYSRSYFAGGGGGGSFVAKSDNTPVIVAGGGGGCGSDGVGRNAITQESDSGTGSPGYGGDIR